jgi:hypothetical protein
MNVVDVNVVIRNRITEEHVFQEKEPRKNKTSTNEEKFLFIFLNGKNHTIIIEGTNYK